MCDAFLKEGYAPGQPPVYDASVYGDGSLGQPLDPRRQHDSQRPSNESSYRQGEGAQAPKTLAQSYGAKLPLKIQLKPQSMNSSRQSKHSANSTAVVQSAKIGLQRGGLQATNEMVIQQNYDCSPKPRSLATNGSVEPNKLNFASVVASAACDEAGGKASSS